MAQKRKNEFEPRPNPILSILGAISRFIGWLLSQIWSGLAWAVKSAFKIIAWLAQNAWSIITWVIGKPYQILHYLINGYVPNFDNAREEEVFWRVKRHYRRRTFFLMHIIIFASGMFGTVVATVNEWQLSQQYGWQFSLIPYMVFMVVWSIILTGHFGWLRLKREEDSALGDAMEREYDRSLREKQATNRLGDMMIVDEDDEPYHNGKPKRYTERY